MQLLNKEKRPICVKQVNLSCKWGVNACVNFYAFIFSVMPTPFFAFCGEGAYLFYAVGCLSSSMAVSRLLRSRKLRRSSASSGRLLMRATS